MTKRLISGYLTLILIAFAVITVAALVGQRPFFTYFSPYGLARLAPGWVLPPLLWLAVLTIRLIAHGNRAPLKTLWRSVSRHRFWLMRGVFFTFFTILVGRAINAFKSSIPNHTSYWADPIFADLDRIMFFGNDPWTISHAVFGATATLVMDRLYILWFFVMMALVAWLSFTRDPVFQLRGLLTFVLSWAILGMAVAMAFASVGPVYFEQFYGDNRFSDLTEIIRSQPDLKAILAMDFLYDHRGEEKIGNGISAMPSMHVAIAWLFYLMCHNASVSRYLTIGAAAFATITLVASVHLSWHYALDGFVSIIGVSLIWWATGAYVAWLCQSKRSQVSPRPQAAL